MRKKPDITQRQLVAQSRLFQIEAVDLKFSNGNEVTFERLVTRGRGAVMIIPIHEEIVYLVREYAAGVERYELGFPKGIIDPGETPLEAANREIQEEIGFAAHQLREIRTMTPAPGYINARMTIILAEDLYPASLPGDEPEPLELVPWPLADLHEVLNEPDFTESRSIAAIFLIKEFLQQ